MHCYSKNNLSPRNNVCTGAILGTICHSQKWDHLQRSFLDHFFVCELHKEKRTKVVKLINLSFLPSLFTLLCSFLISLSSRLDLLSVGPRRHEQHHQILTNDVDGTPARISRSSKRLVLTVPADLFDQGTFWTEDKTFGLISPPISCLLM